VGVAWFVLGLAILLGLPALALRLANGGVRCSAFGIRGRIRS
jgi:hypothetical protein